MQPTIAVFTDWDGTITSSDGQDTIQTLTYQATNINFNNGKSSSSIEDIVLLLQDSKNKGIDTQIFMTENAIQALGKLSKNQHVKIFIITKNWETYIKAMLLSQGFNSDQFTIIDRNKTMNGKENAIHCILRQEHSFEHAFILDDAQRDYESMLKAAKSYLKSDNVTGWNSPKGTFYSDDQVGQILSKCSHKSTETSSPEQTSDLPGDDLEQITSVFEKDLKALDKKLKKLSDISRLNGDEDKPNKNLKLAGQEVYKVINKTKEQNKISSDDLKLLTQCLENTINLIKEPTNYNYLSEHSLKIIELNKSFPNKQIGKLVAGALSCVLGIALIATGIVFAISTFGIATPLSLAVVAIGAKLGVAGIATASAATAISGISLSATGGFFIHQGKTGELQKAGQQVFNAALKIN